MEERSRDHSDWSTRAEQLHGRICWYREPPSIRGIVLVLSTKRIKENQLKVVFEVLASASRRAMLDLDFDEPIEVSTVLGQGWNQLWMIHPLEASTLEDAMKEVEQHWARDVRWTLPAT